MTGEILPGHEQLRWIDPDQIQAVCDEYFSAQGNGNRSSRKATRNADATGHGIPPEDQGEQRSPEDLLARYRNLKRIARRKGDPKPSASEWDYHLACEARRVVDPPITEEEGVALLRFAREMHGETKYESSLRGTVAKAFAEVDAERDLSDEAQWLTNVLGVDPANPIVGGRCVGEGEMAIVFLTRADGSEVRFPRLRDLYRPLELATQATIRLDCVFRHPKQEEATEIARMIGKLCGAHREPKDEQAEAEEWVAEYLGYHHSDAVKRDLTKPGQDRYTTMKSSPAIVIGPDGERWIGTSSFMAFLRERRVPIGWEELRLRMTEIGFEWRRVQQQDLEGNRKPIDRCFFLERDDE